MKIYGKTFGGIRIPVKRLPRPFYVRFQHFISIYRDKAVKVAQAKKLPFTLGKRFWSCSHAWNVFCSGVNADIAWAARHFDHGAYHALIACGMADNHYENEKQYGDDDNAMTMKDLDID